MQRLLTRPTGVCERGWRCPYSAATTGAQRVASTSALLPQCCAAHANTSSPASHDHLNVHAAPTLLLCLFSHGSGHAPLVKFSAHARPAALAKITTTHWPSYSC